MENDGKGMLYFPLFNYSDTSLDVLERLHRSMTRMGLSDAEPTGSGVRRGNAHLHADPLDP